MLKKLFLLFLLTVGFTVVLTAKTNAAVDISLTDSPEENILQLSIDSKEAPLAGVSIDVNFSSNLIINEITGTDDYCTMTFDATASNGIISVECLNDSQTAFNGVLATVEYENIWGGDYFFFVNQATLDIGANTLGMVVDVNRPDDTELEELDFTQQTIVETTLFDDVLSFIRENYLYVTSVAAIIVLGLFFLVIKDRNKV